MEIMGAGMKKIVMVLFVCFVVPAFATEMCARNDAVVVPLDAAPDGTGYGNNGTEHIWWTDFSYGRIYGLATCLSAAEGGKPTGSMGSIINAAGQMLPADDSLGGRTGQDADGNDRTYCWCKMTHPASSRWVFQNSYSVSDCTSNCAYNCGIHAQIRAALRSGLFGSVGK